MTKANTGAAAGADAGTDSAAWTVPDDLLARIAERAPGYDTANAFCAEDLEELRAAGYLRIGVPVERGGSGLGLRATATVQRTLAQAAPATALGLGMHQVWVQAARAVTARGESFLQAVTDHASDDHLLAFGVSEPGNDAVLFDSSTTAEPDGDGGYRFTGTKVSTSLAPAWDVLSVFGKDESGPEPRLVHGFVLRSDGDVEHLDDWDTLGMRATQSRTTKLHGVHVPADRIVRSLPVGPNQDPLVFGVFAAFELLIASVYVGIAERAITLAVSAVGRRVAADGSLRSQDPDVRRAIAELRGAVDAITLQVDALARSVDEQDDLGTRWFPLLVGTKARAVDTAQHVVDEAMRVVGGSAFRSSSEIARLARDVRAGQYHPSSRDSAARTLAASVLGPPA
ncbi:MULTISPECIES: acyl-CoA dehydrogenase family protein [unclassified Curtobacterium]|uniref:acyl-CoA dehydrogenase family protein n=1 Tax=unclassified Curtobacterium TaxID=257496 RepID=UPI000F4945CA|nr:MULTISPECIES: acyl-CoA dehydrogenase family protein [unclassified Curtobacterium]ROQ07610.1 alkylation response protein AidB-like acyl-CoA dehydrogenase [Curtobacterium sp. PhB171]ROQ23779.1 alkylation response protein AidB-like acyl-CoA dehydrogenase [Curtobacterium sp. PhB170]ROS35693.1 alkylation response protein AidB-like acyl-CoA dehydrogenase [Curtobacterium sp. PhB131]ROS69802.1 alkylation response protein AidB-like acyl-CoA dehydrogenase [Curtobacterium sp. PhB141]